MINTLNAIKTKLSTYGTTYYQYAPVSTSYPYIVYNVDVGAINYKTQNADLVVSVWDDNLADCIAKADEIWKGLRSYSVGNSLTSLWVRQAFYQSAPTDDEQLHRFVLNFTLIYEEE